MAQMNLSVKQNHRHGEQTGCCQVVEGEGMEWEASVSRCKLLYIEQVTNKVLLIAQRTSQYPSINHNAKEYKKKECLYMYN